MILRDPVHGLVSFEGLAERVVEPLLAAREVQRLRRVRQLGFASLVFPGAEHSRFAHALGAAHVMVRLLERLRACEGPLPADRRIDERAAADAIAAALLHDLGHGPYSHLFEAVLPVPRHHEEWTIQAVRSPETEVHAVLEGVSSGMAERVAGLLSGRYVLPYLARAVSGRIDVDRCDYLLRDSHMTGVRYGLYDLDWLLQALTFAEAPDGEWVLAIEGRKGLPPIEGFFLGRNFMYQQVYHHKATRAAESLVRAMFVRVGELVREGRAPEPIPAALEAGALGEEATLARYLDLDDAALEFCFAQWERGSDPTLAHLAGSLRHRRLPKTLPLPEGEPARWEDARSRAEDVVRSRGMRPDLTVWLDVPSDTPYAEPTDRSAEGLWVQIRHQPVRRLGEASFLLGELRNKRIERPRLIFPADVRREVRDAVQGVLS
ncbi:MAG: HD domain-containing protein [Myxococcota bacterium]